MNINSIHLRPVGTNVLLCAAENASRMLFVGRPDLDSILKYTDKKEICPSCLEKFTEPKQ